MLSLLIPAFSLPYGPHGLSIMLLPLWIAPLPMSFDIPKLRCQVLAPIIFGAESLDQ